MPALNQFERHELAHQIRGAALGIPQQLGPVTYKAMCELISCFFRSRGVHKTPEEIFNYSPTGELFELVDWYRMSLHWVQTYRALPAPGG